MVLADSTWPPQSFDAPLSKPPEDVSLQHPAPQQQSAQEESSRWPSAQQQAELEAELGQAKEDLVRRVVFREERRSLDGYISLSEHQSIVADWENKVADIEKCNSELLAEFEVLKHQSHQNAIQTHKECEERNRELNENLNQLLSAKGDAKYVALSDQVQRLSRKLQNSESANVALRGELSQLEQQHQVEVTLGRKNTKQVQRLERELATLQEFVAQKESRMESLKKQAIDAERGRVQVLKIAKMSVHDAALKFQTQAEIAGQAIADNQVLKEELASAHTVMQGFKERAERLSHLKKELSQAREEVGTVAKKLMECEEKGTSQLQQLQSWADEMLNLAEQTRLSQIAELVAAQKAMKRGQKKASGVIHATHSIESKSFPAVRGASPKAKDS